MQIFYTIIGGIAVGLFGVVVVIGLYMAGYGLYMAYRELVNAFNSRHR